MNIESPTFYAVIIIGTILVGLFGFGMGLGGTELFHTIFTGWF